MAKGASKFSALRDINPIDTVFLLPMVICGHHVAFQPQTVYIQYHILVQFEYSKIFVVDTHYILTKFTLTCIK